MLLKYVVLDNVEYKLNVFCVGCTCEVWINVLRSLWVDVNEHCCNKLSSLFIVTFRACMNKCALDIQAMHPPLSDTLHPHTPYPLLTCVAGEVVHKIRCLDFLFQEIFFV